MQFTTSFHPVSWFRDRYREGSLVIKPPYQRKPVWTSRQKCYLIESILMDLPIPEIYVQQTTSPEGQSTYAIVDGQQRIRTVLQFIGAETDPTEADYNKFGLDKLETTSSWRNTHFADLADETKKRFFGYQFSVRYLNTESEYEVKDMFKRLNKFLTPLKPQELRNATYSGPFARLALQLADNEYFSENGIVSPAIIRRMGDVEFLSELVIGVLHGPQGGGPAVIDSYYAQYEDYEDEFPDQKRALKLFLETLETVRSILPGIRGTRWSNRTDYYSLFVAVAALLKRGRLGPTRVEAVRKSLESLAQDVERRLADEDTPATKDAVEYVRAVEKGANDKKRRADRHAVLVRTLARFFGAPDSQE